MNTTLTPADSAAPEVAASDFSMDSQSLSLKAFIQNYVARLRGGELGLLPALLSIVALGAVFIYATADKLGKFWSLYNGANLIQQAAAVTMISVGVTFALLLGEIDLAAGWTAGVTAGVMVTALRDGRPLPVAIAMSLAAAAVLGLFTGYMVSYVGVPSFVVTLSNFLIFQGILLLITGNGGTVQLKNPTMKSIMNGNMRAWGSWVLAALAIVGFAANEFLKHRRDVTGYPLVVSFLKSVLFAIPIIGLTFFFSQDRSKNEATKLIGFPIVLPLVLLIVGLLSFLLNRTAYGRHLYATGGNTEAARRAGINVKLVRLSAFVMCALVSGFGGYLLSSRSSSVDPQMGGNQTLLLAVGAAVIGGTSLFGGKGKLTNALMGGLALAMIDNGLPLVGKATPFGIREIDFNQSGIKYIASGLFLFFAASLDALTRKRASAT
jgi:D-xylose transport system permease protein